MRGSHRGALVFRVAWANGTGLAGVHGGEDSATASMGFTAGCRYVQGVTEVRVVGWLALFIGCTNGHYVLAVSWLEVRGVRGVVTRSHNNHGSAAVSEVDGTLVARHAGSATT